MKKNNTNSNSNTRSEPDVNVNKPVEKKSKWNIVRKSKSKLLAQLKKNKISRQWKVFKKARILSLDG